MVNRVCRRAGAWSDHRIHLSSGIAVDPKLRPGALSDWHHLGPDQCQAGFGILPMLIGSVWLTIGALIIGVPFGLAVIDLHGRSGAALVCRASCGRPFNCWPASRPLSTALSASQCWPRWCATTFGGPGSEHSDRRHRARNHDPAKYHCDFGGCHPGGAGRVASTARWPWEPRAGR